MIPANNNSYLTHSSAAKDYYQEAVPKNSFGMEKYVVTDGKNAMFVKSDYQPSTGETVFYIKRVRGGGLYCQFYRAAFQSSSDK